MFLEGRNPTLEALRAGMPLTRVLIAAGTKPDRSLDEIVRRAGEAHVAVSQVARAELDRMSERGAHQGVIAEAAPFKYASLEQALAPVENAERALVIAFDHVTDPGNLGAVARTAEVVGAAAVIVQKRRSAAVTPAAWKSAAGALAHVPVVQEANLVPPSRGEDVGRWYPGGSLPVACPTSAVALRYMCCPCPVRVAR
jgi:23S rRNA (guanosine2251-2'-O)-methyltransferase